MKKIYLFFITLCLLFICFNIDTIYAVSGVPQLPGGNKLDIQPEYDGEKLDEAITKNAGADSGNIVKGIVYVINFILFFVGLIAFIFILYAGFLYLTAGSDENAHKKAIIIIKNATIGIVIIVLSYAITYLLVVQLPKGEIDGGSVVGGGGSSSSGGGGSGAGGSSSAPKNVITKDYTAKILKNNTGSYMYCTDSAYTDCYNIPTAISIRYFNANTNKEVNTLYVGVKYNIKVMLNPLSGKFERPTVCRLKKDIWGIDTTNPDIDADGSCNLDNGNILTFSNVTFNVNQNYRMQLNLQHKSGTDTFYEASQFIDVILYNENNKYVSIESSQIDRNNFPNIYLFVAKCRNTDADCDLVKQNYEWSVYKGSALASTNDFEFINGTTDTSQSPQVRFKTAGEYDIKLSYYESMSGGTKMRAGTASVIIQVNDTFNINDIMRINMLPKFNKIKKDISTLDYIFPTVLANTDSFTLPINITINALENGSTDYKYSINFGDGRIIDYVIGQTNNIISYSGRQLIITYTYKNSGKYNIKLTVTKISTGRSFDINRQVVVGDGTNVQAVIVSEIQLKYINADHIGSGSSHADANFPIYKSTEILFDGSMSVGLSGIDKDLRYFWTIEENGKEEFTTTQKSFKYNFKNINESQCNFSNNINKCSKVKLRVTSTKDYYKTNEKIVYVRVSKENIIPEFKMNNKLYVSPNIIIAEVNKKFADENNIVNYIWQIISMNNNNIYVIKNTASPKVQLPVEFNMGDDIPSNNSEFGWCRDLQGRLINIKLTVINVDGQAAQSLDHACILPNMEEPIIVLNILNNIYKNKDKNIVFSGYAKTRNGDIYNLIPKGSTIPSNQRILGIAEWSIVKTKDQPEVYNPIWNNTTYQCSNASSSSTSTSNRYPDYCVIPIDNMSSGEYYVRFLVTNISLRNAIGPNFYGYKIMKFTIYDSVQTNIDKADISVKGNPQLKLNTNERIELFDHVNSVKSNDSTVKWSIKYEFSDYYTIYTGNNFLTQTNNNTYAPLVVTTINDTSCTHTKLLNKIKTSELTTDNKKLCLLTTGKYNIVLDIIDRSGKKSTSIKTIDVINNTQPSTQPSTQPTQPSTQPSTQPTQPSTQPSTQPNPGNISARLTIRQNSNVYEGNDNYIHINIDESNVVFDFSKSIGDDLKYYFDADLSYDSDFDGITGNDQDNTDIKSTSFTYKYKRAHGNIFRARLQVVDKFGRSSSVIRNIKFDPK